ncbi:MAG: hypothetical protein JWM85_293 [Acidimicrobiaceae bacterium]|jgi:imidazolonepropionase-like amidohydrolase|nr:hypothetical protein [Acidimicrobiaceae bacterium]
MIIADVHLVTGPVAGPVSLELAGDRITAVHRKVPRDRGDVLDGEGRFAMPGLVNAHDHLALKGLLLDRERSDYYEIYRRPAEEQVLDCARGALTSLAAGITTVRDAGAAFFASTVVRDAIRAGRLPGPDVRTCGLVLSVPFEGEGVKAAGMTVDAAGSEGVRAVVADLVARGVDWIKLKGHRRDFADAERTELFSPEEIALAGAEAHRHGRRFAVHAWHNEIVEAALAARVADSIEHGNVLGDRPDLLAEMAAQGVIYVPNLVSWAPTRAGRPASNERAGIALERVWDAVSAAIAAGVRLAAGTDLYTEHLHEEVAAYRELGLTPEGALGAVTANGAALLGLEGEIGAVAPGHRADVLLLDADPRDDLAAMSRPHTVVLRGHPLDGDQLRALVAEIPAPAAAAASATTPAGVPGPGKEQHS